MSPLFAAIAGASSNHEKTCMVLLDAKARSPQPHRTVAYWQPQPRPQADVNEEDEDSETNALHQAIDKKRFGLVKFLIDHDANRNDKDVRGYTPLAKALPL